LITNLLIVFDLEQKKPPLRRPLRKNKMLQKKICGCQRAGSMLDDANQHAEPETQSARNNASKHAYYFTKSIRGIEVDRKSLYALHH